MSRPPEAFLMFCWLDNIDLPAIDAWLADMKPSANRDQLLLRRKRAEDMFLADSPDELWQAPLEFLGSAMYAAQQRKALLPLARTGKKSVDGSSKGNDAKVEQAKALHAKWQTRADAVWADSPELRAWKVAEIIAEPGEKADTIRRRIKPPR